MVKRKTQSKRQTVKLKALRVEARRRMHAPVSDQFHCLCQVLRGHYAYYVRIPLKANADSEGKANNIPGRRGTFLGA